MHLTVAFETFDQSWQIEVPEDLTLAGLRAYVEAESSVPQKHQVLSNNNQVLNGDDKTLKELGLNEHDLVILRRENEKPNSTRAHHTPASSQSVDQRSSLMNPAQLMANQNPDDPATQAKILEFIRQQQIEENLQLAYDIAPESFVSVNLLFIKLKINGHEATALVDSGAQATVIHSKLAEKFGISNLIDKRFASMSRGVGSQQTKGRIHNVAVSLSDTNIELPCSFTVLDTHVGILLGLDMLKRHKCNIDLSKDALVIGDQEIKFMSDAEIERDSIMSGITGASDPFESMAASGSQSTQAQAAPAQPPAAQRKSSPQGPTAPRVFPESSIASITSLGFSREEALSALAKTNGNVELAASLLF